VHVLTLRRRTQAVNPDRAPISNWSKPNRIAGNVGAAVIATCERLGKRKVATLDRRHSRRGPAARCDAFELLPALDG